MTVKDLIEKLKSFNQDLPVRVVCEDSDPINEAFDIIGYMQIDLSNNDDENAVILKHE